VNPFDLALFALLGLNLLALAFFGLVAINRSGRRER
jgi:hypothetical protein